MIGKPAGYGKEQQEDFEAKDYHQPSDEVRADWDYSGAVEDAQLLFHVGVRVANAAKMPAWKPGDEFEAVGRSRSRASERSFAQRATLAARIRNTLTKS